MKPTVGVAFESSSDTAPLMLRDAITGVAPPPDPPPRLVAFTRTLVIRKVRATPTFTGGSTGTLWNTTLFPETKPWNPLYPATVADVPCGVLVATCTGEPPAGVTLETNSVHPVTGVGQMVSGASAPKGAVPAGPARPDPGSSINSSASERPLNPVPVKKRLVTAVL